MGGEGGSGKVGRKKERMQREKERGVSVGNQGTGKGGVPEKVQSWG